MLTKLRSLLTFLLGDFSWKPPGWFTRHRRATLVVSLLVCALAIGGWEARQWYLHRPKPVTVKVWAYAPDLTPIPKEGDLRPKPIIVNFGGSVARLDQFQSATFTEGYFKFPANSVPVTSGIHLEPAVLGTWHWTKDDQIIFEPKNDWVPGQRYTIVIDPKLLREHTLLDGYEIEIETPRFEAVMEKFEFYTDPRDPAVKQVNATFKFTHPVDLVAVQKKLDLVAIGGSEIFPKGQPKYQLTCGKYRRTVYLRSSPLILPEHEDFARLTLEKGLTSTLGGQAIDKASEYKVVVPDLYSFFKIDSSEGKIVRNKEGEPEQVLLISTTGAAKSEELQKSLHVYLLPKKGKPEDDEEKSWAAKEVNDAVLSRSLLLPLKLIPSGKDNSTLHSFKVSLESTGQLYIEIDKGVRALGGFVLGENYSNVIPVPELPREIEIQGAGGVLALSGERKLSVKSRGVKEIEYEIARVPADQINHLVSQTRGEFQNPEFVNYHFGRENIARIATERQTITLKSKFKANYSAFDFSSHLKPVADGGSPMQGLFFLTAREWVPPKVKKDKEQEEEADANSDESNDSADDSDIDSSEDGDGEERNGISDERFILVTDLGMIVKENTDGSRDVFLASVRSGEPLGGVSVEVLAKNGVPIATAQTAADGRLTFPSFGKPTHEKSPVAYVARLANDVAFMPYAREDRELDFSRFDTGGVEARSGTELDASVFTERGIYRPGDEIKIGLIVKQRDWGGHLEGLPIETEIVNARDTAVQVRKLALPAMGFAETSYQTSYESPSGSYHINVYLARHGKRGELLGETSVQVKEFLPDRMKIESHLSKEPKHGWVSPEGITADVTLRNLYGTPATDRRMKGKLVLQPSAFGFEEYPGFQFCDPLSRQDHQPSRQEVDLGEQKTSAQGGATFSLDLERFADFTSALTFTAEGFEADGGRSVIASNSVLVSAAPYVVGAKSDGKFGYLETGSTHTVEWIAIDRDLKQIAVPKLECRLIEHAYLSVLTKQENGDYVYESVGRDNVLHSDAIAIAAEGLKYPIPTDVPGEYSFELHDPEKGTLLSRVDFTVVGRGRVSRSLDKNAELHVKLARTHYATGDTIDISLVAPYTGTGLITIERDKVYAHTWFKADQTSTVQHIQVPADFEGTGYVNVCFVRGLDSKEVFMSPLSYAAVPFQANIEKRRLPITLRVTPKTLPGEPLHIGYRTDRPSRLVVFAVDEGILQVTDYQLPDPLGHFFQQAALMVRTRQIVDLILPEYSILRQASAFGGDGEAHLNPFKRITEKPVVFWSGIVDAGPREREVVYDVPAYFSGTLKVMAVAVAPDAVGSVEKESLVRGPFVLTPNVPTVAAPGDRFDVSVTVANDVEGSGPEAEVQVSAEPSEHLEILQAPSKPIVIPEGHETSVLLSVRAREKLGSASLTFHASTKGQESKLRSTMSVRPASPFLTEVHSGDFVRDSVEVKVERKMYPEFRKLEASVSALPLGLARGLDAFLKNYPNGCSEQITSGAFCRLTLSDETDFGLSRREVSDQMKHTFAVLQRRQSDRGSFGYWAVEEGDRIDFVSVYVMHFLIEAKAAGFAPPENVFQSGLEHLKTMVALEPGSLRDARIQAYAIYLLTREGITTTNYILNLRDFLDKHCDKSWHGDLAAVYLAGAEALLMKQDEALKLIKGYRMGVHEKREYWDFYTPLDADSQFLAILARHFPDRLKSITPAEFQSLMKPIAAGQFSTLSAAYAVVALKAYSHYLASTPPSLEMSELIGKSATPLRAEGSALLKRANFSDAATAIRFTVGKPLPKMGVFNQTIEAGYDLAPPKEAISDGLEITRSFLDAKGQPTYVARLGEPLTVQLRIRSLRDAPVTNVALVDLLPGGFELAAGSLAPGLGVAGFDFVETREDRVVFFGSVGSRVHEVTYQIKPTNRGDYIVPPAFAESMYDRNIKARALGSRIRVVDAP